ncbi:hypothetical protein ACTFO4_25525 [Bacillus cereus group sp. MYBKT14-1]|uniref:hypothetical protein n=1 Tax=unclassified Bacillus cereus group TaxID=2750818 RepID=UPI003F29F3EA
MSWNEIWQADMNENGIIPLIKGISENEKNEQTGFIIVDLNPISDTSDSREPSETRQVNVLTQVTIPNSKKESYDLVKRLLDNYNARRGSSDPLSDTEINEIKAFLSFAIKTKPMKIVREKVEQYENISSDDEWIDLLYNLWFQTYRNNSTSAFEHIFVGEQKNEDLSGHHFWYHYYLHDGPFEVTQFEDTIAFIKTVEVHVSEVSNKAEVITIMYKYKAKDDHNPNGIDLIKEIGGFFVGLSAEGLIAFGTMAYFEWINDNRTSLNNIDINGETYKLSLFTINDNGETYLRTFYPEIIH